MKHKIEFNKQEILDALIGHYDLTGSVSFNVFVEDDAVAAVIELSSALLPKPQKTTAVVKGHTDDVVVAIAEKQASSPQAEEATAEATAVADEVVEAAAQPTRRVRRTREQMLADRAEQEAAETASKNSADDSLEEVAEAVHNQTLEEAQVADESEEASVAAAESAPPVRRRRFTRDESVAETEATAAEPTEQAPVRRLFGRNA